MSTSRRASLPKNWCSWLAALFPVALAATLVLESNWTGRVYNLLACLSLAGLLLLVSRRARFSLASAAFVCTWIWIVSELKFRYLGLRLVPEDFALAMQSWAAVLPFSVAGLSLTLLSAAGLAAIFWHEGSYKMRRSGWLWMAALLPLCSFVAANGRKVDFSYVKPRTNALPIFVQDAYRPDFTDPRIGKPSFCCQRADEAAGRFTKIPAELPDVIVILAESFFDPGRIPTFRSAAKIPSDFSPLAVYTVGGQSWIQEIAVLHGVPPLKYGTGWRGKLDGRLPRMLTAGGYAATTVYPNGGTMYGARVFHLAFGMQRFLDCNAIPGCPQKVWTERRDQLFFRYAVQLLESASAPQFIFLSTVRQHSPHNASLPRDPNRCQSSLSAAQCSVLLDYDRRMQDSLDDYAELLDRLRKRPRRSVVLLFGDHIPADVAYYFPQESFLEHDRYRTLFHIWDSRRGGVTRRVSQPVDVAFLDALLLSAAGFDSTYIRDKLDFLRACNGRFGEIPTPPFESGVANPGCRRPFRRLLSRAKCGDAG